MAKRTTKKSTATVKETTSKKVITKRDAKVKKAIKVASQPIVPKYKTRSTVDKELVIAENKVKSLETDLTVALNDRAVLVDTIKDTKAEEIKVTKKHTAVVVKLNIKITALGKERAELSAQTEAQSKEITRLKVDAKKLNKELAEYAELLSMKDKSISVYSKEVEELTGRIDFWSTSFKKVISNIHTLAAMPWYSRLFISAKMLKELV